MLRDLPTFALASVGGCVVLACTLALALLCVPWPVEATVKATTNTNAISLAGGVSLAGLSLSAAAILGGPGVVALHFRTKRLWRRSLDEVSFETLITWLETFAERPRQDSESKLSKLTTRAKNWLLPRTDLRALPELGLRCFSDLRNVSLHGTLVCGFADAALTGKAAAWLFPLAGLLSPLGSFHIDFDWSGKNRLDGDAGFRCRFVLGFVARECVRFVVRHVHFQPRIASPIAPPPSKLPSPIST